MLLRTMPSTNRTVRYRLEKVNSRVSLFQILTRWEIPLNCHTLRLDACPQEDVCFTLCRWRPPLPQPELWN